MRSERVIVTVKLQVLELPQTSVATQFTVVMPGLKTAPDGGVHTGVIVPQLSVALAVKLTFVPFGAEVFRAIGPGHVIVGAVVSCTVMTWAQSLVLPQASVAR